MVTLLRSALGLLVLGLAQGPGTSPGPLSPQEQELVTALGAHEIRLDPRAGTVAIPVDIAVRDELLEYLLVGPAGATHESVFVTPVTPSLLNVALLALGASPGTNASWRPVEPRPTDDELRGGASPYTVTLPQGSGFYLYVGWVQAEGGREQRYFYRVEDLLRNLLTGHAMARHPWVYLGSRMIPPMTGEGAEAQGADQPDDFAADVYQNLVNIAFFSDGYTLVTAALEDCVEQSIWLTNAWLVPERGSRVMLVFSRTELETPPPGIAAALPTLEPGARDARAWDR
jgi:hypothetical protein